MEIWYSPDLYMALQVTLWYFFVPLFLSIFAYTLGMVALYFENRAYGKQQDEVLARRAKKFWLDKE